MATAMAVQAVVIIASGVLSSTPVVSAIIAGVFLILNTVATLLVGAYLNDRRDRRKPQRKTRKRPPRG